MKIAALTLLFFLSSAFLLTGLPGIGYTPVTEPGGIVLIGMEENPRCWEGEAFLETLTGDVLSTCRGFSYIEGNSGQSALVFILGVHTWVYPGEYRIRCRRTGLEEIEDILPLTVEPRGFLAEDIPLNRALTELMTEPDPQIEIDAEEMIQTLKTFDASAVFDLQAHRQPLEDFVASSFFGDQRRYLYTDGNIGYSTHTGIDMAASEGASVYATAPGKVIMAKRRVITGNTILIEHLPGVFGVYFHLEKIAVVRGEYVRQGQFIGTVGTTGLSTGAHLHWEIRAGDAAIDPQLVLQGPLLDKEVIFSEY